MLMRAPCPETGCSRRFLVANRHRHTVPLVVPKYRGILVPALHAAHTHKAQATPKTIHQSRYQTKTDTGIFRFLSLTGVWPLRTLSARVRLILPWLGRYREGLVTNHTHEHSTYNTKVGQLRRVYTGLETGENYGYRLAGSNMVREVPHKKKKSEWGSKFARRMRSKAAE
jgi:hypothetical protein